jgi:serine/threonine-protein kinase
VDDKYRLVRRIGSGTAGTVYEAEHVVVGRRVAIEIWNPIAPRDEAVRARFVRQARAAQLVGHDNIAEILDVGVTKEGSPYLVTELLDGETLEQLIARRGVLPPAFACELVVQILAGLGAAHALGVVHGALKPANVVVTHLRPSQPIVKILDFGVAKGLYGEKRENEGLLGTPVYMPPEQALGKSIDARADLYAAGVILYEMLCGEAPFTGTPQEVLRAVVTGKWRPLASVNPAVPRALTATVAAAMAIDPAARVRSAHDFAMRLTPYLSHAPPHSIPNSPSADALLLATPGDIPILSDYPGMSRPSRDFPSHDLARVAGKPNGEPLADSLLQSPIIPRAPSAPKIQSFGSTRDLERWSDPPARSDLSEPPPALESATPRDSLTNDGDEAEAASPEERTAAWHRAARVTMVGIGIGAALAWLYRLG